MEFGRRTSLVLAFVALNAFLPTVEAKPAHSETARRKLFTLAELLEAEMAARNNLQDFLEAQEQGPASLLDALADREDPTASTPRPAADSRPAAAAAAESGDAAAPPVFFLPHAQFEEFAQNKRSNLLRLANQAARGFGRR